MGASQVGGIASLLDIDFGNEAGFVGQSVLTYTGMPNFIVYFMSQSMMFCTGTVIEAHVIVTAASCIFGERYQFDLFGGSHKFLENIGVTRTVEHTAVHSQYNASECIVNNLALLILGKQFSFEKSDGRAEFTVGRARYGITAPVTNIGTTEDGGILCNMYGWGSRRNGYLVPLLIQLHQVKLEVLPQKFCDKVWNCNNKYLCVKQLPCKNRRYGALCADDIGSPLICSGFLHGMMTSRMLDRPCGVGFVDMTQYHKFLTCGVDDSRLILSEMGSAIKLDLQMTKSPIQTTVETTRDESLRMLMESIKQERK